MSWLKFWSKKSKDKNIKEEYQKELRREEGQSDDKNKLRHSLSISRSGRFKSKNRERGKILDQPELFNGNANPEAAASSSQNQASGHSRSPNNTCRDVRQVPRMGIQTGLSAHQATAVL